MDIAMRLFATAEINEYFEKKTKELIHEIDCITDQEILNSDLDGWVTYVTSKVRIEPLQLFPEHVEKRMEPAQKKFEHYYFSPYEPEYVIKTGAKFFYSLPFVGDHNLWSYKPTQFYMSHCLIDKVENETTDSLGYVHYSTFIPESELDILGDEPSFTDKDSDGILSYVEGMVRFVNNDVKRFNGSIEGEIQILMTDRKERLMRLSKLSEKTGIHLDLSGSQLLPKPIPLPRIIKKPVEKPNKKIIKIEYAIEQEQYEYLLRIIHDTGTSAEATVSSFSKLSEEEYRDVLLAAINTHYLQPAVGEGFRRVGKTDILYTFKNQAAFIAECKIWSGTKVVEEAIEQLFSYSTWKDNKLALVLLNKHNKNFLEIRTTIENWLLSNTQKFKSDSTHSWQVRIRRDAHEDEVDLNISLFDLHM